MKARLRIRAGEYRGEQGFHITGTDGRGRSGIAVFTLTRESADHIKRRLACGYQINRDDFTYTGQRVEWP